MELRLLHTAAYGEPWFAQWGYKLVSGTHGVTPEMYAAAVAAVHAAPIAAVSSDLLPLISRYACISNQQLFSISHLLRLLLDLLRHLPLPSPLSAMADSPSRWPRKRIEMAACVIVQALKASPHKWMSRQQVRDAARIYVGDTGLLDYVLKSLGNHIFGSFLVRRCLNPVTKVLQYSLIDLSASVPQLKSRFHVSRVQISRDLAQIYACLFNSGADSLLSIAGGVILDGKHLVKVFSDVSVILPSISGGFGMYCAVQLRNGERRMSPAEYFAFGGDTTPEGLRMEVEKEFKDIYWGMKDCMVGSIVKCDGNMDGRLLMFDVLKNGDDGDVYEKKVGEVVDCYGCGTKEDDGERMICCDICDVWIHTRCANIPKDEQISPIFICGRCEDDIAFSPSVL